MTIHIDETHVDRFTLAVTTAAQQGHDDPTLFALQVVAEMIESEHVAPIEQTLAESERDVARLGRLLAAARAAVTDDGHADRLANGAYER